MKHNLSRICITAIMLMISFTGYAFDYNVMLRENTFDKLKYHFAIERFIDKRPDKQKEIGFIPGFFDNPKSVGNDSLEQNMTAFLKTSAASFDTASKFVVAFNKLHLEYFQGYTFLTGKIQDIEISFLLQYYRTANGEQTLFYEQSITHRISVKFIMNRGKAVDVAFSEAVKYAFKDLDRYLTAKKTE